MIIDNTTVAIVTGAASGLGEGVAAALVAAGARVTIFDLDQEKGEKVASRLATNFCRVDVSDSASVSKALNCVSEEQGRPRIVVNCAGIAPASKTVSRGLPHDFSIFEKTIKINLIGTFNVASQAAAIMSTLEPVTDAGERGVIVNTASVAAMDGQIGQIAYAASKGAVSSMTLPMARDLADKGIRVMGIAPGIFSTPMVAAFPENVQQALAEGIPFPKRLGAPAEFAALVMHIVANEFLNGEVVRLDGAIRMPPR